MPNRKKHLKVGAFAGLAISALTNIQKQLERRQANPCIKFNWLELALWSSAGAGVGAACGVLPDLLEPAEHPDHRDLFHSITTGTAIVYGMYKANNSNLSEDDKTLINIAGGGYLSHLLLDSETPNGLPIISNQIA